MAMNLPPGVLDGSMKIGADRSQLGVGNTTFQDSSMGFLGSGDADHGKVRTSGPVSRYLEPRQSDMAGRAKGRQLIGAMPDQGRSAFQLSTLGSTEGLAVHQPKMTQNEPAPYASGSSIKTGGEMPFREYAEQQVLSKAFTKCYTMEEGERAKAYEKAQRGKPTPGPGEYEIKGHMGDCISAVKLFEETRGFKTDLDWTILRAAKLPGPQEYPRPEYAPPSGGNFNLGNSKSDIDWICYIKKNIPGSGTYAPQDNMGESLVPIKGGAMTSSAKEAFYVEHARRFQGIPGPGTYDDMHAYKKTMDQPEGGGRISPTKVPSWVDMYVAQAKKTPGVGAHNVRAAEMKLPQGGRFGLEQPMDTLELSIRHLRGNPGPGAYGRDFQVGLKTCDNMKKEKKEKKVRMARLRAEKREQSDREEAMIRQLRAGEEEKERTERAQEAAATAKMEREAKNEEKSQRAKERKARKSGSPSPSPSPSPSKSPSGSHNPLPELAQSPIRAGGTGGGVQMSSGQLSPVMTTLEGPFDLGRSLRSVNTSVSLLDSSKDALGSFAAQLGFELDEVPLPPHARLTTPDIAPGEGSADAHAQSVM